ncbi:Uncharacterized protein SCP_0510720 [Sparassis crispa]|uniref:Ribophorin II C-terminal domain-containing protein n=1 Tax=Sparassis crispa TaxID=139825 RepID=A0A401GP64_9APHY|nr:Uncharacterized protein SCP_0510720 [Sparassis crispa]GBE84013.1 Uncharacterized protein SCP_0510720 [Sparassis crispa]
MGTLALALLALLATAQAHTSALSLQSPRVTLFGPDATQLHTQPLLAQGVVPELTLGPVDALKLTFQVVDDEGKGVQPHQTFLRFVDEASGEEGIQPVRVTAGGKAKFELNMARPPASLPPTAAAPLNVTLLLGSFTHTPAKYDLFSLTVPPSLPLHVHPDEASFHPRPPIAHTFREPQKRPPPLVSALFTYFTVAPWLLLTTLWTQISPRLPHLLSPYTLPFMGCLGAFEVLLFWYWVDLRLGQVLLYSAGLGAVTVLAGQQALSRSAAWRANK